MCSRCEPEVLIVELSCFELNSELFLTMKRLNAAIEVSLGLSLPTAKNCQTLTIILTIAKV